MLKKEKKNRLKMLKPLLKNFKPKDSIGFDIETDTKNHNKFMLGSFYFTDDKFNFRKKSDMINFILNEHKRFKDKIIYAHNLGFDFLGLFYDTEHFKDFKIVQRGADFILAQAYIHDGKFWFMLPSKIRKHKDSFTKIVFYDTFSYYKSSLKKIGDIIGIKKLKSPEFVIPKTEKEWSYLEKYNYRDSEICKKFADFLQVSFNKLGCNIKSTIASTSMDLFRRKYLKEKLWTPNKKWLNMFYQGYYGGRTEILNRGTGNEKINIYDFNSLYPSVMKRFPYPHPNFMHKTMNIELEQIMNYEGLSKVVMESNDSYIPYLPLRTEKLIFPNGIIRGVYTNYEIRKAIEYGYRVKKLFWGIYYTKTFNPFINFVDDLIKQRLLYKKQNNPIEIVTKISMNSLYGKFSQNIFNKTELVHLDNITSKQYEKAVPVGRTKFFRIKKEYKKIPDFIIPILSIYTSAYARTRLYELIEKLQDNVFYMDTDSVFTTKRLKHNNRLGSLGFEYSSKQYTLTKPKFYGMITDKEKNIIKIKGFMSCPQNYNFYITILKNPIVYYKKFLKLRECLRSGFMPNDVMEIEKVFGLEDDKRIWTQSFDYKDFENSKPLFIQ